PKGAVAALPPRAGALEGCVGLGRALSPCLGRAPRSARWIRGDRDDGPPGRSYWRPPEARPTGESPRPGWGKPAPPRSPFREDLQLNRSAPPLARFAAGIIRA